MLVGWLVDWLVGCLLACLLVPNACRVHVPVSYQQCMHVWTRVRARVLIRVYHVCMFCWLVGGCSCAAILNPRRRRGKRLPSDVLDVRPAAYTNPSHRTTPTHTRTRTTQAHKHTSKQAHKQTSTQTHKYTHTHNAIVRVHQWRVLFVLVFVHIFVCSWHYFRPRKPAKANNAFPSFVRCARTACKYVGNSVAET